MIDLDAAFLIVDTALTVAGGHVVVRDSQRQIGTAHCAACQTKAFKGLGAGDFMYQMTININQRCAILVVFHQVGIPNFIVQGFRSTHLRHSFPRLVLALPEQVPLIVKFNSTGQQLPRGFAS